MRGLEEGMDVSLEMEKGGCFSSGFCVRRTEEHGVCGVADQDGLAARQAVERRALHLRVLLDLGGLPTPGVVSRWIH